MKSLYNCILEAKNDNLHEFIQYLHDHSKRGTLKSKYKKDEIYPQFIADCSIEKFNNREYDYDMISLRELLDDDFTVEHYLRARGKWGKVTKEVPESDYADFIDWCADEFSRIMMPRLTTNNNNCIYIERAITIPRFSNKSELYKEFKKEYNGHFGVYWAYAKGYANPYFGLKSKDAIILKGYVRPEDADWGKSISSCIYYGDEGELRINKGAPIQLIEIVTGSGNHTIFDGKIIIQA